MKASQWFLIDYRFKSYL